MLYQPQSLGYKINRKVQGAVSAKECRAQLTEKFKVLYQPQSVEYTTEKFKVLYQPQSLGYTINRKVQRAVSATESRVHN